MSPVTQTSQSNMFKIPGTSGNYSADSETAQFDAEFERIHQADARMREVSSEVFAMTQEHEQLQPEIVDGTPLIGKLDEQQSIQEASAAVHEQIEMTAAERNRQLRDLEAMWNMAERIEVLRSESDVVS